MSNGLRFACSPKRWKKLVADVRKAIGLETMFRRSGITAIILETSAGNCRFDLDESGERPGQASGVSRPIKAPARGSRGGAARREFARPHPGRSMEWRCAYALELIDAVIDSKKTPAFQVVRATLTVLDFGGIAPAEFLKYLEKIGRS